MLLRSLGNIAALRHSTKFLHDAKVQEKGAKRRVKPLHHLPKHLREYVNTRIMQTMLLLSGSSKITCYFLPLKLPQVDYSVKAARNFEVPGGLRKLLNSLTLQPDPSPSVFLLFTVVSGF